MAPRHAVLLLTAALAFALPALPGAAACTYTPLVTLGEPTYPADGAYLEEDCYGHEGRPVETVTIQDGALLPCYVQPIYVLGEPVPGTGTPLCPEGASVEAPAYPDVGVTACSSWLEVCSTVSTHWLNFFCDTPFYVIHDAEATLPTGDGVRATCTLDP